MAVSEILNSYRSRLESVDKHIAHFFDSLNVNDIVNDPALKVPESSDAFESLSLTELTRKLEEIEQSKGILDQLWYVRGYIRESQSIFELGDLDESDLESVFNNLDKLLGVVEKFPDTLVIKSEITEELRALVARLADSVRGKFGEMFPNEYTYAPREGVTYGSLTGIAKKVDEKFHTAVLSGVLQRNRQNWDGVLDTVATSSLAIEHQDVVRLVRHEERGLSGRFDSVASFMAFINEFSDASLRNFYRSRVAALVTDITSENIDSIIGGNEAFDRLVALSRETGWNLPIERAELNKLHASWVSDKYVDKIRTAFRETVEEEVEVEVEEEEEEKEEEKEEEEQQEEEEEDWNDWDWDKEHDWNWEEKQEDLDAHDDWNDKWADGWDDEIHFSDEEPQQTVAKPAKATPVAKAAPVKASPVKASPVKAPVRAPVKAAPKSPTKVTISRLARCLVDIFREHSDEYMVTAVQSLALVSYPPPLQSFLMYNDMGHLSRELRDIAFRQFGESQWTQASLAFTHQLQALLAAALREENDFAPVEQALRGLLASRLPLTNSALFTKFLVSLIDTLNTTAVDAVVALDDITEERSERITSVVDSLNSITLPCLAHYERQLPSNHKLEGLVFLVNHHLSDIIDRFYDGELFDFTTQDLIKVIKSVFVKSELRDGYISEIIDSRTQ